MTEKISTYPRKGTETQNTSSRLQRNADFNLSPQGDGNLPPIMAYEKYTISTYPRKGTETLPSEH